MIENNNKNNINNLKKILILKIKKNKTSFLLIYF